ncbi:MAG: hypothetical protein ACO3VQ_02530 [Ilumatobacteraceae bacterium]
MTFTARQVLTAAQLNDLSIDSLTVDTDVLFVDKTNDRVGIGTTSPDTRLHIEASQQTSNVIRAGNGTTYFDNYINDVNGEVRLSAIDPSGNNYSKFMTFATSPSGGSATERVRIDSSGNVGIGTTSPAEPLDVTGSQTTESLMLRSGDNSAGTGSGKQIVFGFDGTTNYAHNIRTRHSAADNAFNAIDFVTWNAGVNAAGTYGTNYVMSVVGTQRVGIADLTPSYTLDVNGDGRFTGNLYHPDAYAFVEGATSGSSTLQFTGTTGTSNSTFFSVSASGITINRSGRYFVMGGFRANGTGDVYAYLGINGTRSTIEARSDSGWTHDHASYTNQHTHSNYIGYLAAGWTVTLGTSSTARIYYGTEGWASYIFAHYIGE